ncbi:Bacterial regulatory protein, crp family [Tepidimonas sediminis]|uniref:Bacterial regulatory protein, crp family n=1 Tax=Tepidimonas sediminis TaxID=2588941 RepID=A0A554WQL3_9BURK|nr:Crp/Fnr family transcriptional regulator [Tepidimonas sediminis]TSE25872.1 Bacterial regulatory protein, crp family [Tepidimonas sediminis]
MPPASPCNRCATQSVCALRPLLRQPGLDEAYVRERRLAPDETLLAQGVPSRHLHAIKVGALLLRRNPGVGGPRAVAVLGAGHALSLRALVAEGPGADAVAVLPTRVCELPLAMVRPGVRQSPEVAGWLVRHQLRVTETLADWAAVARLPDALSRVAATVQLLGREQGTREIGLPPRDDLAELCGCAPETTSRMLARLERDGLVLRLGRRRLQWFGPGPDLGKTGGGGMG